MSLSKRTTKEDFSNLFAAINKVLSERKFQFDIDTILKQIKLEALKNNIEPDILESSYFYISILNSLDNFIDHGKIYRFKDKKNKKYLYCPSDYIIFTDYCPSNSQIRLLYFITEPDDDAIFKSYKFMDIETTEVINLKDIVKTDFIICGGNNNDYYKTTLQSNISFEEISKLYHDFIDEGATKGEAVNHILNYYKAYSVSKYLSWANDFVINDYNRQKKLIFKPEW